MSIESDKRPHMTNTASWGTVLGFVVLLLTQLALYAASNKEDGKKEERMAQLVKEAETHVIKTELDNRLATQEYKIQVVLEDVKENKETLKDVQKTINELLQRIPKPQ